LADVSYNSLCRGCWLEWTYLDCVAYYLSAMGHICFDVHSGYCYVFPPFDFICQVQISCISIKRHLYMTSSNVKQHRVHKTKKMFFIFHLIYTNNLICHLIIVKWGTTNFLAFFQDKANIYALTFLNIVRNRTFKQMHTSY
jgi:hypothetical protein